MIEDNCAAGKELIDVSTKNMDDASIEVKKQEGRITSLFVALVSITALYFGTGGLGAIIAGAAGYGGYAYRDAITKKVINLIYGPLNPPQFTEQLSDKNPVAFHFDVRSGGLWQRFFGRVDVPQEPVSSKTQGVVKIWIKPNVEMTFNFDLDRADAMSAVDADRLMEELKPKLEKGEITPDHCLAITDRLASMVVTKDSSDKPTRKGFIVRAHFTPIRKKSVDMINKSIGEKETEISKEREKLGKLELEERQIEDKRKEKEKVVEEIQSKVKTVIQEE